MSQGPTWRRYLRFWRPDVEADVDDEIRFHLEERVEDLVARGLAPADARARALEEFGDVRAVRAGLRAIDRRMVERRSRAEWWAVLGQEVRQGARRLVGQPGFTVPAVLTLALGLAATAAVFAVLDALVLTPLPYPRPERLVRLESAVPGIGEARWGIAKGQARHYLAEARSLESLAIYRLSGAALDASRDGARGAEQVVVAEVSASLHAVLGAVPVLGRALVPEDNLAPAPRVALLAHDVWTRDFGADSAVVGRTVSLGGRAVTIAGILPPRAELPDELRLPDVLDVGLWVPLHLDPAEAPRNNHVFRGVARLREGVTLDAARADLARLTARFPETMPSAYSAAFMAKSGFAPALVPLRDDVLGDAGRTLWTLFGATGLVLLIACANVANLWVARVQTRRRETAVRAALGADRRQLARHWLAETVPLAVAGGALALVLARLAVRALVALAPSGVPRLGEVGLGATTAAFVVALALAIGVALGLLALGARGASSALAEAGRGTTVSRRERSARGALVVTQVAMSLMLLAAAGLLARSIQRLRAVEPGFAPEGALVFRVSLPPERYATFDAAAAFYRALAARLGALPGVRVAGATSVVPLTGVDGCSGVLVDDRPAGAAEGSACVEIALVTPGSFEALGIPLRGAAPGWGDLERRGAVAVVSEAFARQAWPGVSPIGRTLRLTARSEPYRVIGVAGDVRAHGLDRPGVEAVYLPITPAGGPAQWGPQRDLSVVVRAASAEPAALVPAIRRVLAELDPGVPVGRAQPLTAVVAKSTARLTLVALLIGVASAVALVLSAVGIYGVIGYLVASRRAEIGIRLALGARASEVGRMVVGQSVRMAALGVALGLALALVGTRLLSSLLFGVGPGDPLALGGAGLVMVLLAAAASWGPARRAMRVDPGRVLRHE